MLDKAKIMPYMLSFEKKNNHVIMENTTVCLSIGFRFICELRQDTLAKLKIHVGRLRRNLMLCAYNFSHLVNN